jgi:pimeloyl-ACP methyl ester carboxylesterase
MAAVARALGASRWVAVGHDWGAGVAWRCALRHPEEVAAVFGMSVPHAAPRPGAKGVSTSAVLNQLYPDRFVYARYFEQVGAPEAELERDVRSALKQAFFSMSGDAPDGDWLTPRPLDSAVLDGLTPPPAGPLRFMPDDVLDRYVEAFEAGGLFGPLSWYRNNEANLASAEALGDQVIRQPSGFLVGDKELVTAMFPGLLEAQRRSLADLRVETRVPGAGHWLQWERPELVAHALLGFLADTASRPGGKSQPGGMESNNVRG